MMIQGSLTAPAAEVQRPAYQPQPHPFQNTVRNEGSTARRFDSVTIYAGEGRQSAYELELRSKISQEVRTATSSGMISELRQQIQGGTYRVDPSAIAQKMLLLGVSG
ncbi:MAG: flagellar biosynthesis anti-sigma factor FlgM [Oscillibacter sp.]|nr:flagellar biosynthesis anti-sigma factor FlgM [Oscillibacter sp.]